MKIPDLQNQECSTGSVQRLNLIQLNLKLQFNSKYEIKHGTLQRLTTIYN